MAQHRGTGDRDRGATSIEYAILASMIAAVIVVAVAFVGSGTQDNFDCYSDSVEQEAHAC